MFPAGLWGKGRRERVGLEGTIGEQQQEAQSKELKQAEYEHREPKMGKKCLTRLAETVYQDSAFP